jgi:hypothetical protein
VSELGEKRDDGKLRFDLLPWGAVREVVRVLTFGAAKYARTHNWIHVPDARERYFAALHRHLDAWWAGEAVDPESKLHHLAHAGCCLCFLLAFEVDENVAQRMRERR